MGQIFSHPATIIVVILLIVLLFGAPKLPGMARSLGQSMRIFKTCLLYTSLGCSAGGARGWFPRH